MYNCTYCTLYIVQCLNITVTTDNGALTLLPALLHRGRNFLHFFFRKITKYFFLKLPLLRTNHEFKVFVCFGCFNFPSDCCKPCLWFSSAGVTVADETLSFAEYIFNYPNYQISRCQNKSKYCPPCPPLRGRLEREIEPKKIQTNPRSFFFHISCKKNRARKKSF